MLLRHICRRKETNSESEQQEGLMHGEECQARIHEEQVQLGTIDPEQTSVSYRARSQSRLTRIKRMTCTVRSLAAVLMVGTLISSMFLLLTLRMHSATGSTNPSTQVKPAGKVVAKVEWNGLTMSMSLTAGPYFLGELVAADFSLTNGTHQTLTLDGVFNGNGASPCPFTFILAQTGGKSPHYTPFTMPVYILWTGACTITPPLAPGRTITYQSYELLTSSGDMTLVGKANIHSGVLFPVTNPGLLFGHFPTLHIHVMSQVPTGKMLKIHQKNSGVVIDAPPGIHPLVQMYVICYGPIQAFAYGSGHNYWDTTSRNVLPEPECSGSVPVLQWKYAIGAEGYEVVQGQYSGPYNL